MRVVFMGTPEFAANILDELKEHYEVVAVYTQPDRIRGRGKALVASPVKALAVRAGIEVRTPRSLTDVAEVAYLRALAPQVICVAAYGKILPREVLEIPAYACLNVHASLLPRYRGAAPVERAILAGEEQTGVCVMRMEETLDTGPYCVCRFCDIGAMSADRLTAELAEKGARALLSALFAVEHGKAHWTYQDETQATYAPKIEKGELDPAPQELALVNLRRIQASGAIHPSRAVVAGRGVTLLEAKAVTADDTVRVQLGEGGPGQVRLRGSRLFLGCADGPIEVMRLKPDGKKEMAAAAFARGIQGIQADDVTWEQR